VITVVVRQKSHAPGARHGHNGAMLQETSSDEETPPPAVVAAWLVMNTLRAESVPMWAASWLVEGYDGEALAELAGLSGRDTREVRDLLPAALADAGVDFLPSRDAGLKVAYDYIATMHLSGRGAWFWAINQVQGLVIANDYAPAAFEYPLGDFWSVYDELGEPWARTEDELAQFVHQTCSEQLRRIVG
jgi:hypothetical protein